MNDTPLMVVEGTGSGSNPVGPQRSLLRFGERNFINCRAGGDSIPKGKLKKTKKQMLRQMPPVSSTLWDSSNSYSCLVLMDRKRNQLSALKSYTGVLKFAGNKQLRSCRERDTVICCNQNQNPEYAQPPKQQGPPQNVDLPPVLPRKQKKPFPVPIKKILQAGRAEKKLAQMGIERRLEPPKNGIIVPELVPVARNVLGSWKLLIKGVAQLLHVIPVYGCKECSEVHVAETGHNIRDCLGNNNTKRQSKHSWVRGSINDILVPIESYHLYDPFGRRIKHETRFDYDRIPAIVELCIQAGVDIPEYPSRRRTTPIRMMGKKVIDRGGIMEEPRPWKTTDSSMLIDLDTHEAYARFPPPMLSDVPKIAQETVKAYECVRSGVRSLMKKYSVKACGYCSEVHVGPWGHNAKLCGEFKHQWRDGKHGWQDATLDEVVPPNYVWHMRDPRGPPLKNGLKRFYGKAPAVIELCVQAGATKIPEKYKAMMRLDIVVPDDEEARLVA